MSVANFRQRKFPNGMFNGGITAAVAGQYGAIEITPDPALHGILVFYISGSRDLWMATIGASIIDTSEGNPAIQARFGPDGGSISTATEIGTTLTAPADGQARQETGAGTPIFLDEPLFIAQGQIFIIVNTVINDGFHVAVGWVDVPEGAAG